MLHWLAILTITGAVSTEPTAHRLGGIVAPPAPPVIGQAIDRRRPAFVPKFAKVDNPPVGHFAEREWAYLYSFPSPSCCGSYGYGGFGSYGGYGYGGFHNFDGHFVGTAGDAFR